MYFLYILFFVHYILTMISTIKEECVHYRRLHAAINPKTIWKLSAESIRKSSH